MPKQHINPSTSVDVPPQVAKCPECGARLLVYVTEWGSLDGIPTDTGAEIWCVEEYEQVHDEAYQGPPHRGWQSDWQDTHDRVNKWVGRHLRVVLDRV